MLSIGWKINIRFNAQAQNPYYYFTLYDGKSVTCLSHMKL